MNGPGIQGTQRGVLLAFASHAPLQCNCSAIPKPDKTFGKATAAARTPQVTAVKELDSAGAPR